MDTLTVFVTILVVLLFLPGLAMLFSIVIRYLLKGAGGGPTEVSRFVEPDRVEVIEIPPRQQEQPPAPSQDGRRGDE